MSHDDCGTCQICVNGACVADRSRPCGDRSDLGCAGRCDTSICIDDSGRGEGCALAILADYFTCQAPDCGAFKNDGLQLRPKGVAIALLAPGEALEPGEAYCEVASDTGTYAWDGQQLRVDMSSGTLKGTVDVKAGLVTISWMSLPGGGNILTKPVYMKRVTPRSAGSCQ